MALSLEVLLNQLLVLELNVADVYLLREAPPKLVLATNLNFKSGDLAVSIEVISLFYREVDFTLTSEPFDGLAGLGLPECKSRGWAQGFGPGFFFCHF